MKLGHHYYVYIVECSDGYYYTGVTNNVERSIAEHNEGLDRTAFAFKRRPVVLRYCEHFVNIQQAIAYEKQLKGWSGKKKEALFYYDYKRIKELSKSKKDILGSNEEASTSSAWQRLRVLGSLYKNWLCIDEMLCSELSISF